MANAMEQAGAQVICVTEASGEWYVWCRCESEEMMDDAVGIYLADWKKFQNALKRQDEQNRIGDAKAKLSERRKPLVKN